MICAGNIDCIYALNDSCFELPDNSSIKSVGFSGECVLDYTLYNFSILCFNITQEYNEYINAVILLNTDEMCFIDVPNICGDISTTLRPNTTFNQNDSMFISNEMLTPNTTVIINSTLIENITDLLTSTQNVTDMNNGFIDGINCGNECTREPTFIINGILILLTLCIIICSTIYIQDRFEKKLIKHKKSHALSSLKYDYKSKNENSLLIINNNNDDNNDDNNDFNNNINNNENKSVTPEIQMGRLLSGGYDNDSASEKKNDNDFQDID